MHMHASDCSVNNPPAIPRGLCDCGAMTLADELRHHAEHGVGVLSEFTIMLLRLAADRIDGKR